MLPVGLIFSREMKVRISHHRHLGHINVCVLISDQINLFAHVKSLLICFFFRIAFAIEFSHNKIDDLQ